MCLWPVQHWILQLAHGALGYVSKGCSVDMHSEEESRGNQIRMLLESILSGEAWLERNQRLRVLEVEAQVLAGYAIFYSPNQRDQDARCKRIIRTLD